MDFEDLISLAEKNAKKAAAAVPSSNTRAPDRRSETCKGMEEARKGSGGRTSNQKAASVKPANQRSVDPEAIKHLKQLKATQHKDKLEREFEERRKLIQARIDKKMAEKRAKQEEAMRKTNEELARIEAEKNRKYGKTTQSSCSSGGGGGGVKSNQSDADRVKITGPVDFDKLMSYADVQLEVKAPKNETFDKTIKLTPFAQQERIPEIDLSQFKKTKKSSKPFVCSLTMKKDEMQSATEKYPEKRKSEKDPDKTKSDRSRLPANPVACKTTGAKLPASQKRSTSGISAQLGSSSIRSHTSNDKTKSPVQNVKTSKPQIPSREQISSRIVENSSRREEPSARIGHTSSSSTQPQKLKGIAAQLAHDQNCAKKPKLPEPSRKVESSRSSSESSGKSPEVSRREEMPKKEKSRREEPPPKKQKFLDSDRSREAPQGKAKGIAAQLGISTKAQAKYEYSDEEYDSEMEDFICDDDEEAVHQVPDVIRQIRTITGYDPSRYKDDNVSDYELRRSMTATYKDILKEEKRSERVARKEDAEELRKEAEHKARKKARKN